MGVENIIYDVRLSSVVPAQVTGEKVVHELTNMDLVMKLHYLKGVYYFKNNVVQGLTIHDFKKPMFQWLALYYPTSGRIRKSESDRPLIKCNDSGVRIVEAKCDMTLEECLEDKDISVQNSLVPDQVLGPDLAFSPLVFMQFTWFKCGGISVGVNWAHVLGDVFSASSFMNMWGHIMAGKQPPKSLNLPKAHIKAGKSENLTSIDSESLIVKRVEIVKESWIAGNNCRMETFSFQITATQLNHIQSKISNQSQTGQIPPFEALCAVIWHGLAKIRGGEEPRRVITCRKDIHNTKWALGNNQILRVVKANFSVAGADPSELAALIVKWSKDEMNMIEDAVEREQGLSHYIVYGANLTFIDLEDVNLYGLEMKGEKPVFANYTINGVGDEGVVLVLPGPENSEEIGGGGRTITVTLPDNNVMELRYELERKWGII